MNQFWVDPEELGKSGDAYEAVRERLASLQQTVASISDRYASSFGDDEEGQKFQRNFDDGQEQFLVGINQQAERLRHVSDGLKQNGRDYQRSNDDAGVLSKRLLDNGGGAGGGGGEGGGKSHFVKSERPEGGGVESKRLLAENSPRGQEPREEKPGHDGSYPSESPRLEEVGPGERA